MSRQLSLTLLRMRSDAVETFGTRMGQVGRSMEPGM